MKQNAPVVITTKKRHGEKIRRCVEHHGYHTCAECPDDVARFKVYSYLPGNIFTIFFKSERPASISYIQELGEQALPKK